MSPRKKPEPTRQRLRKLSVKSKQLLRRKLREALRQLPAREEALLLPDADPDSTVNEILELLSEDRYQTARRKAAEAVRRFPDHPRVQGTWGIFDTHGKAKAASGGPASSRRAEFD